MASAIPDLWPKSIRTDVFSPLAILRFQAHLLRERTGGLLEADIVGDKYVDQLGSSRVSARFDVVAKALEGYRHELLRIHHVEGLAYPVHIDSGYLPEDEGEMFNQGDARDAENQDQFISLIAGVFQSTGVVTLLESLIAQINDNNDAIVD